MTHRPKPLYRLTPDPSLYRANVWDLSEDPVARSARLLLEKWEKEKKCKPTSTSE